MIIVTSGSKYLDIDAFACCFAYREMLTFLGKEAIVSSNAIVNSSVIPEFMSKRFDLNRSYNIKKNDKFAIMDVSNPDFLDKNIMIENIEVVIDHHTGFENYWLTRLGESSKIEFIGAAATIVFEEIVKNNAIECIDKSLANLMMAAILDNTLNFSAKITSKRDYDAYKKLKQISNEKEFEEYYFSACQREIELSLINSIKDDLKCVINIVQDSIPDYISQLTIWDAEKILNKAEEMTFYLNNISKNWMINLISLKDKKSYIISASEIVKSKLEKKFNCEFVNDIMILSKPILRKEIIKLLK